MATDTIVRIEGQEVELTHLDKVLYPETGFTKAQVIVSKMAKSLRPGKVLIDWSQNTEHKTMACVYSLRARARPTVSMPLRWEEVERAAEAKDASRLMLTADQAIKRIEKQGDLFKEVLTLQQGLPSGLPQKKTISVPATHVAPPPLGVIESPPGAAGPHGTHDPRSGRGQAVRGKDKPSGRARSENQAAVNGRDPATPA